MRITKLLVLPFVLLLVALAGCDENNNMISQPGEGDPTPKCEGVNLDECPCDYNLIAKDEQCWVLTGTDDTSVVYTVSDSSCKLAVQVMGEDSTPGLTIDTDGFCGISLEISDAPLCSETNIFMTHDDLTQGEIESCQCKLEQYTKELIQSGISVNDDSSSALAAGQILCPAE